MSPTDFIGEEFPAKIKTPLTFHPSPFNSLDLKNSEPPEARNPITVAPHQLLTTSKSHQIFESFIDTERNEFPSETLKTAKENVGKIQVHSNLLVASSLQRSTSNQVYDRSMFKTDRLISPTKNTHGLAYLSPSPHVASINDLKSKSEHPKWFTEPNFPLSKVTSNQFLSPPVVDVKARYPNLHPSCPSPTGSVQSSGGHVTYGKSPPQTELYHPVIAVVQSHLNRLQNPEYRAVELCHQSSWQSTVTPSDQLLTQLKQPLNGKYVSSNPLTPFDLTPSRSRYPSPGAVLGQPTPCVSNSPKLYDGLALVGPRFPRPVTESVANRSKYRPFFAFN